VSTNPTQPPVDAPIPAPSHKGGRWSLPRRVLFRFTSVFLVLSSLLPLALAARRTFQDTFLFPAMEKYWVAMSVWVVTHVFGVTEFNPRYLGGDSIIQFARIALCLFFAAVATTIWTIVDRRRPNYTIVQEWLRLFVAIVLALTMVRYGVQKVMVVQMAPLSPHQLLAPLGLHTPRQLLWVFMGAAPAYQIFTGLVEVFAGVLLFVPRLLTLGALLTLAVTANVLAMNVAYDVEVKLFACQLLVMAGFLLLPDLRRIADVFVFNRGSAPVERPRLITNPRFARLAAVLPLVTAAAVTALTFSTERAIDRQFGAPAPAAVPHYGIWDVEEFALEGTPLPPLSTDAVRWQRLVFDARDYVYVQRMSGSLIIASIKLDPGRKMLAFDHGGTPRPELKELVGAPWKAEFSYESATPDVLVLTGTYENRPATVKLRRSQSRFFLTPHERQWMRRGVPLFPYV
jgi:uncharacterized membrane protein YphA (DoxX/SURF4 family)